MSTGPGPATVLPLIDIGNTFGALLIGSFIAIMLYGLTILQTYLYYAYYPEDRNSTKFLIAIIWVLDTLHAAFMAYSVYFYLVIKYSSPALPGVGHWSLFLCVGLNTFIACITQTFFLVQIHRLCLTKYRWWVTSLIGLSVLAHFAFGIEIAVLSFIKSDLEKLSDIRLIAGTPFAIFTMLSDVLIAGALCYLFHGNRSGFKRTDTIISTLIIYAINRCLLTAVALAVQVIAYCTMPSSLWYLAIDFFVGKLYANSLLATLNGRVVTRASNPMAINSLRISTLKFDTSTITETKPPTRDSLLNNSVGTSEQQTSFPPYLVMKSLEEGSMEDKLAKTQSSAALQNDAIQLHELSDATNN